MEIGGAYPMLYAFLDETGGLRRNSVTRRIGAALASGSRGTVAGVIAAPGRMTLPNTCAGFDLLHNRRAGADGLRSGTETIDRQAVAERACCSGIVSEGLRIAPGCNCIPCNSAAPNGIARAKRWPAQPGPLAAGS